MQPTTERKIHFVKIVSSRYAFEDVLTEVDGISGAGIYSFLHGQGGGTFLRSLEKQNDMYKGIISRLRMDGLPSLGTEGERLTQNLALADNQGLVESTHFIYFKDSYILALEFNHLGPRASTLEWHLIGKMNDLHGEPLELEMQQIFDENTLQVLNDNSEIRLIQMAVPKEKIVNLAEFDPSIHAAFQNAANFNRAGKVEISLRFVSSKRNKAPPGNTILDKLRHVSGTPADTFSKLKVSVKPSPEDHIEVIDLLQNKLVVKVELPRTGRAREIDSAQMFEQLQQAYQSQSKTLKRLSEYETVE